MFPQPSALRQARRSPGPLLKQRNPFAMLAMATLSSLLLVGCASGGRSSDGTLLGWLKPYHVEIVQGNVVTKEQVAQVQPGMVKAQVRDVLGSPLLTDPFHADRWDYVFSIRRAGTVPQQRRIVAWFDGEKLSKIEGGDDLPSERDFVDSIDVNRSRARIPTLAMTEEQIKALPAPKPVAASASQPEGAVRSYPPLEPASP